MFVSELVIGIAIVVGVVMIIAIVLLLQCVAILEQGISTLEYKLYLPLPGLWVFYSSPVLCCFGRTIEYLRIGFQNLIVKCLSLRIT